MGLHLNDIKNNIWIKNIITPFLLITPILFFSFPLISIGTGNLRIIRHFDADEASLVEFAGKTYSKILIPVEDNVAYPQFFYYIAGIVLFPYTLFKGINYNMIVFVLRSLNILSALLSAIFIYYIGLKFFKSIFAGFLSSLIFTTSSGYLRSLINSRPHTLEIFFIIIAFYFCFKIVEEYKNKYFLFISIFLGLATSTKFGGLFAIPIFLFAIVYSQMKLSSRTIIKYSKPRSKSIVFICSSLLLISVFVPFISIILYLKFPTRFTLFGIKDFKSFVHFRNFRLLIFVMTFIFFCSLAWMIINFMTHKLYFKKIINKKDKILLAFNNSFLLFFYCILINLFLFLILNPTYWLFPISTLKQLVFQFAKSTMGTSFDPGLTRAIFDPSSFVWIKIIFDNVLLNNWFGILFVVYLVYEISFFRKNLQGNVDYIIIRILLLLYIAFLFSILFIFVSHRPHHYLLPISLIMGMLIAFGVVSLVREQRNRLARVGFILFFSLILILGFYERAFDVFSYYKQRKDRNIKVDTGLIIGSWLEENFDENIIIWKDARNFYVPLKFQNVFYMQNNSDIEKNFPQIKEINPKLLIITSPFDSDLNNAQKVNLAIKNGILSKFKEVKVFKYNGPLGLGNTDFGTYKEIHIYSRLIDNQSKIGS